MIKIKDPAKSTCVPSMQYSASCIKWKTVKLKSFPPEMLDCDPVITEVIMALDCVIEGIQKQISLADYNSPCDRSLNGTWNAATLLKSLDSRVCSLAFALATLQTTVNTINFGNSIANINLHCLQPAVCEQGLTYNQVLELFASTICQIQRDLNRALIALNLTPGAGNQIYIPSN